MSHSQFDLHALIRACPWMARTLTRPQALGQVGTALEPTHNPVLPGSPPPGVAQCLGSPATRRSATWTSSEIELRKNLP
jgi:hypothetical protein